MDVNDFDVSFARGLSLEDGAATLTDFTGRIIGDISKDPKKKDPMFFVNPSILWTSSNDKTYEEGCLSVPGQFAEIERPEKCKIKFLDYEGNPKELNVEGLLSTCILFAAESIKLSNGKSDRIAFVAS